MSTLKALEIWTAQTLCDIGILLSVLSFLLHIGRPYFDRHLARFPLRVAADTWWLAYVVLRDGSLFGAAVLGFWHLNLDLMADIKVGLPFVPMGTVVLAAALLMKVFRNAEDLNRWYRRVTGLGTAGAMLNVLGYVLVMEAPGAEYAVSRNAFWRFMVSLRSNANPDLSVVVFYVASATIAVLVGYAVVRSRALLAPGDDVAPDRSTGARDVPA